MTGLLDRYVARKRKRQESFDRGPDVVPIQAKGPSRSASEGGSEVQAIVIPGSPEMEPSNWPGSEDVAQAESREAGPVPVALQVVPPFDRAEGQPSRFKFTRTGLLRLSLLDRILTNYYLPSHGPTPPKEEVSMPGLEVVKHIMHH